MLSIDPGTRVSGAALWENGVLITAGPVKNSAKEGSGPRECAQMAWEISEWSALPRPVEQTGSEDEDGPLTMNRIVDVIACEYPQIYSRGAGKTKGDPNRLLPLVGVDCALAALFKVAEVRYCVPHDWKQSIKKPKSTKEPYIIRGRVEARLTPEELARIDWTENVRHSWDVTDAVGIGLHFLGRFARMRVLARE